MNSPQIELKALIKRHTKNFGRTTYQPINPKTYRYEGADLSNIRTPIFPSRTSRIGVLSETSARQCNQRTGSRTSASSEYTVYIFRLGKPKAQEVQHLHKLQIFLK